MNATSGNGRLGRNWRHGHDDAVKASTAERRKAGLATECLGLQRDDQCNLKGSMFSSIKYANNAIKLGVRSSLPSGTPVISFDDIQRNILVRRAWCQSGSKLFGVTKDEQLIHGSIRQLFHDPASGSFLL